MNERPRILIVEDQETERRALERLLKLEKFDVLTARDAEEAKALIGESIDLVISDLRMAGESGVDLLEAWREAHPGTPFILVTAYGQVDSAVRAMKLGATDYLIKPVNPEQLLAAVRDVLSRTQPVPPQPAQRQAGEAMGFGPLVGRSPGMLEVFDKIRRSAQTDSLVLVLGESGTGKELVAAAIHEHSRRNHGPYVAVNMAAIPGHLVESELFGHVRGAFTGATTSRIGRFQAANKGTIFIDEIGDFEAGAQAKLLRVLENLTVCPIGSNDEFRVDVRVIAATSRNLPDLVSKGLFREDLYYRLNVVVVRIPPLRERREDIPLLAGVFLSESATACGRGAMTFDDDLREMLLRHPWPGNVRQLRNSIHSMVVLAKTNDLTLADLPEDMIEAGSAITPSAGSDLQSLHGLDEIERSAILAALGQHEGNRTRAAAALGISVRTLQRKLKSWGM